MILLGFWLFNSNFLNFDFDCSGFHPPIPGRISLCERIIHHQIGLRRVQVFSIHFPQPFFLILHQLGPLFRINLIPELEHKLIEAFFSSPLPPTLPSLIKILINIFHLEVVSLSLGSFKLIELLPGLG